MKRELILFGIFFIFLALFLPNISNVSAELTNNNISKAYTCLQNKTANCSTSLDDNIFTLLTLGTCKDKVMQKSTKDECWPAGNCNVKQTAQALLALEELGSDTAKPKSWLISHNKTATNIEWFLQTESSEATKCKVSYGEKETFYPFSINEDKKINSTSAGLCLTRAEGDYWFKISSDKACSNYKYKISCDKKFQTSTLFKKQTSPTIYVWRQANWAEANGSTTEEIKSLCFADKTSCVYEGTLWATLVLSTMKEDISPYVPYLVTSAGDNPKLLPEAFLYILLGNDYEVDFLSRQKSSQYWDASGDKYYDTALALLALIEDDKTEKTNSLDWLEDVQGKDGCWQTSIKNNAFLLYTLSGGIIFEDGGRKGDGTICTPKCTGNETCVSGKCVLSNGGGENSCETTRSGSCMSRLECSALIGTELDYSCTAPFNVCCDKQQKEKTCVEKGGEICSSGQICSGGTEVESSDSYSSCCVDGGSCIKGGGANDENNNGIDDDIDCEFNSGTCRPLNCQSGEQSYSSYSCVTSSDLCCMTGEPPNPNPTPITKKWWLWVLVILIILVILAILFRDRLRRFWIYLKTKSRPSPPSGGQHSQYFPNPMRMIPRRILPQTASTAHHPMPRKSGELDEVLKKLKDMSR